MYTGLIIPIMVPIPTTERPHYTVLTYGRRYIVWRNLFVHAQPEIINMGIPENFQLDVNGKITADERREFIPAALIGAGIRQSIAGRASAYFMALYDVIQDHNSPYYKRPDFRVGFNIGF